MTKSLRLWQWWLWFWAVWQYPGKATLSYCRFLWTVLFASLALTPSHSYQISLLSVWGQIWTRSKKTKRAKVFTKERCLLKEKRPTCSFTAQVSWTLLMQCAFVAKVSDFSAVSTFFCSFFEFFASFLFPGFVGLELGLGRGASQAQRLLLSSNMRGISSPLPYRGKLAPATSWDCVGVPLECMMTFSGSYWYNIRQAFPLRLGLGLPVLFLKPQSSIRNVCKNEHSPNSRTLHCFIESYLVQISRLSSTNIIYILQ
jgi:hypothetical protein